MMRSRLVSALVVAFVLLGWLAQSAPAADPDHDGPDHAAAAADPHGEGGGHGGHGSHGGGEINPLAFQGDLALWTGVVFLLLMLVLWPFWTKIAAGLQKREEGIADQIARQIRFIGGGLRYVQAKEALKRGEIGDLLDVQGLYAGSDLLTAGTHVIDLMRYFVDDEPIDWLIGQIHRQVWGQLCH